MVKKIAIIVFVAFATSCSTHKNVDIKDYPVVTTITDLSEYYELNIDKSGKYESTSITSYWDGSSELEYSYELLETKEFDPLFYSITIEKGRSVSDAKEAYSIGKGTVHVVGNAFDQGTIEIDSIELPGDESYYALRTLNGQPNGMFYIVRKGAVVYTMMMSGLYSTDHSLLNDLLLPKIAHLEKFEIIEK